MKIHRLFADRNGESHFETVEIPLTESSRAGRLSARMPATGIIFREVLPDYDLALGRLEGEQITAEIVRAALTQIREIYGCLKPYEQKELMRLVLHRAAFSQPPQVSAQRLLYLAALLLDLPADAR